MLHYMIMRCGLQYAIYHLILDKDFNDRQSNAIDRRTLRHASCERRPKAPLCASFHARKSSYCVAFHTHDCTEGKPVFIESVSKRLEASTST